MRWRVMVNADIAPSFVGGNVVNPEGRDLPLFLDDEVMNPHRLRLAFGAKRAARVFKIADIFLLFGVDRDGRLAIAPKPFD